MEKVVLLSVQFFALLFLAIVFLPQGSPPRWELHGPSAGCCPRGSLWAGQLGESIQCRMSVLVGPAPLAAPSAAVSCVVSQHGRPPMMAFPHLVPQGRAIYSIF